MYRILIHDSFQLLGGFPLMTVFVLGRDFFRVHSSSLGLNFYLFFILTHNLSLILRMTFGPTLTHKSFDT
jgi:hypothetical protein